MDTEIRLQSMRRRSEFRTSTRLHERREHWQEKNTPTDQPSNQGQRSEKKTAAASGALLTTAWGTKR